ncbi:peptide transporter PTR2-A [Polychaeton citri CBS 116435]|uniref:Peptide transporter PTR2-A n=1 Tax=Polychaeton citri CBS 116435 TaxID=1314669 RepID=A0A9P4Q5K7_9PEZI|nr:peptide transporter PTR2-A [Polychaeton citri CBS 116435]
MGSTPFKVERREATEDEVKNLRHVVDSIPNSVWIALTIGSAERFTFYAVSAPWQNYMQNKPDSIAVPGVLGLGQATATNISNAFSCFSFITPLPFAILSDSQWGRYKTLCISFLLVVCGCIVLFVTSLPQVREASGKVAGLALAMILLGLGTGGVKATVSPFIGDQYTNLAPQLVVTKKANEVTRLTNIASLSLIASTYLEKEVGFWAAYLLPLCSSWAAFPLLLFWRKSFARICFVPFYLCMNQITNNLVSQAGQTRLSGISNDTIQAFSPIACVLLCPVIQSVLYPSLQKYGTPFGPIARMTWAFIVMGAGMSIVAGLQKLIYTKGPCYQAPLACPASNGGSIPNDVSVWVQTPVYFLIAFAEILGFTTLSEYSYSKAPKDMRSLVQAFRQISAGLGSALGMALSPVAVDPKVMYLYTGLTVVMILSAPLFWVAFRNYDRIDEQMNALETNRDYSNDDLNDDLEASIKSESSSVKGVDAS